MVSLERQTVRGKNNTPSGDIGGYRVLNSPSIRGLEDEET